jgi:hypothetical protein
MSRIHEVNETNDELNTPSCKEATRKELTMRSKLNLLVATGAAVIFAAHTASAQNGGGLVSNTTSAATTSTVTVTIPGVVGIDIESDVVIDLTSYVTAGGVHANGTACPANTFPPPAGCTGAASYAATATNTTAGAPVLGGSLPAAGNIWLALFCSKTTGTMTLQAAVSNAWAPVGGPGFATTSLRNTKSAANNPPAAGNASATAFATSATSIGIGSLGSTFGWTRADQLIDLSVAGASALTFNAGSFTTTATFTVNKS